MTRRLNLSDTAGCWELFTEAVVPSWRGNSPVATLFVEVTTNGGADNQQVSTYGLGSYERWN